MVSTQRLTRSTFTLPHSVLSLILYLGILVRGASGSPLITRAPSIAKRESDTVCALSINPIELRFWCCDLRDPCGINTYISAVTVQCSPQPMQPETAWFDHDKWPPGGCRSKQYCCPFSEPFVRPYVLDDWASVWYKCDDNSNPFFMTGGWDWQSMLPSGTETIPKETHETRAPKNTDTDTGTINASTFCTRRGHGPRPNQSATQPTRPTQSQSSQPQSSMQTTARASDSTSNVFTYTSASPPASTQAGPSNTTSKPPQGSSGNGESLSDRMSVGGMVGTAIGSLAGIAGTVAGIYYGRKYQKAKRELTANQNSTNVFILQNLGR